MTTIKTKKYNWFIGTDISRNKLDHAVMKGSQLMFHKETGNDAESIRAFIKELKQLTGFTMTKSVFCMENTGIYGYHWISVLRTVKANIVREQSLLIMKSQGPLRGKSDKIDSIRIAEYAYLHREKLRLLATRRPVIEQLHQLNTLRTRMLNYQNAIAVPINESSGFISKKLSAQNKQLCNRSITAMALDAQQVERQILELIYSDLVTKRLYEIILSVPYFGPVTAVHMLIATNEFKNISDPKKFACYSGIAPFPRESGTFQGKRKISGLANKRMKSLLHMCAVQAMRYCPELKAFYIRKTEIEGKPKMVVINAIRYKLVLRVFACVAQDRLFEKKYVNPKTVLPPTEIVQAEETQTAN